MVSSGQQWRIRNRANRYFLGMPKTVRGQTIYPHTMSPGKALSFKSAERAAKLFRKLRLKPSEWEIV